MSNTPVILPEASAIQWNEYIVFLTKDGTVLLCHTKHNMWTTLSKCTHAVPDGLPLANYRGQITTLSNRGQLVSFASSQWRSPHGLGSTLMAGSNGQLNIYRAVIIPNNDILYVVIQWCEETTQPQQRHATVTRGPTQCDVLSYDPKCDWKIVKNIPTTYLQSAALVNSDLYIWAGYTMYRISLSSDTSTSETDQDTKIPTLSHPPHEGSTLHVVKGNLFAFGGREQDNQPSSDVLRYNPGSNSWENAGYMRCARYNVVVTTVQQDNDLDVLVFGGSFGSSQYSTNKPTCSEYTTGSTQTTAKATTGECPTCIVEKCSVE